MAHLLMMFVCTIYAEGAESLRSLQEPALSLSKGRGSGAADTTSSPFRTDRFAYAFVVPALRKTTRKTGHPLCW